MFIQTSNGGGGGGGGGSSFTVIQTDAGTDPVATGPTDTLTLTGTQITTTGNSTTDTVTFSIAAGAITNTEVNASAAIAFSKLASLASANILVGSAGSVATSVAVSGDITITNAGVTAIGAGKIVNAQINASAAIDFSKLATLTSANILVGNVSNVAASVAMSGDITITNAGVTAIGAGKIVNAQINSSAAIDFSKLATLTSGNILVGSASNVPTAVAMSADATIVASGAVTVSNAAVIGKVLTGWATAAGPIVATDTILQGFGKAVTGPASSTASAIPLWNGTTGHLLQSVSSMVGTANGDLQLGVSGVTSSQSVFTTNSTSAGNNACDLVVSTGNGNAGGIGRAGDLSVTAGGTASANSTSRPGNIAVTAGSSSNASNTSAGGNITLTPGTSAGGQPGAVTRAGRTAYTGIERETASTTVTIANNVTVVIADYGSLQGSATYTLPAAANLVNGQHIKFGAGTNGITALTLNAGSGSSIVSPLTTLIAGTTAEYVYVTASTTWYRVS